MSAHLDELLAELRELGHDIRNRASDTGYGIFPGGDPNTFTPDPDASTKEERDRHNADCGMWNAGIREGLTRTACTVTTMVGGAVVVRTPSGYGHGTYVMEDPEALDWAERLESIESRLRALAEEG